MAVSIMKAAALLLACTQVLASPRDQMSSLSKGVDLEYRPQYGEMGSRPRDAVRKEEPGFPAHRVKRHEFDLHRRRATNANEDTDLVAAQSWYWGEGICDVPRWDVLAVTDLLIRL